MSERSPEIPQGFLRRNIVRFSKSWFNFLYLLPIPGISFYNLGVSPVPDHVRADPAGAREPFQAALYDRVYRSLPFDMEPQDLLVEISSGKGAGAAYLGRVSRARILPLEPAWSARVWSLLRYGLRTRHAWADDLPLAAGVARALISVESAHNYMTPDFAAEAFRVLAPGGTLVVADFPLMPPARQAVRVRDWLEGAGFEIVTWRDQTADVIAACEADSARKRRIFRCLPGPVRRAAEATFSCDPSPRLDSFRQGKRGYYLVVARKAR